ncbi:MAG: CoA transferase [Pseudomonadota bacterium]
MSALAGITIFDLTRFLSGPYATQLLAGLGARVIKIDPPDGGDPTASAPPFATADGARFESSAPDELGLAYLKRNRGKQSVYLDIKSPRGNALFLQMVERADVVIENFRPGVAARLGIDYPRLAKINPRIICCAISGYGEGSPERDLKSYDLMAQAASGIMGLTGSPDGPPAKIGSAFSDMVAGTYAALAVSAALHERSRSGTGQHLEVSMVDCLFAMQMDEPLDCYAQLGLNERQGNRIMRFSPFNTYASADGWVAIGVATRSEWQNLTAALNRPDLTEHPEFSRPEWRVMNNAAVDAVVAGWAAERTNAEIVTVLNAADVPCAEVRTAGQALASAHVKARRMLLPLLAPDGSATKVQAANLPMRFSRSEVHLDRRPPAPGGDTASVLHEWLTLSPAQLHDLAAAGVIPAGAPQALVNDPDGEAGSD